MRGILDRLENGSTHFKEGRTLTKTRARKAKEQT